MQNEAYREQLIVKEVHTLIGPGTSQHVEPHELYSKRVDKAQHTRAIEECGMAKLPVLQLLPIDKAQQFHPPTSPVALQTNCAWKTDCGTDANEIKNVDLCKQPTPTQ